MNTCKTSREVVNSQTSNARRLLRDSYTINIGNLAEDDPLELKVICPYTGRATCKIKQGAFRQSTS